MTPRETVVGTMSQLAVAVRFEFTAGRLNKRLVLIVIKLSVKNPER